LLLEHGREQEHLGRHIALCVDSVDQRHGAPRQDALDESAHPLVHRAAQEVALLAQPIVLAQRDQGALGNRIVSWSTMTNVSAPANRVRAWVGPRPEASL
jgi:hypothetical protein